MARLVHNFKSGYTFTAKSDTSHILGGPRATDSQNLVALSKIWWPWGFSHCSHFSRLISLKKKKKNKAKKKKQEKKNRNVSAHLWQWPVVKIFLQHNAKPRKYLSKETINWYSKMFDKLVKFLILAQKLVWFELGFYKIFQAFFQFILCTKSNK